MGDTRATLMNVRLLTETRGGRSAELQNEQRSNATHETVTGARRLEVAVASHPPKAGCLRFVSVAALIRL